MLTNYFIDGINVKFLIFSFMDESIPQNCVNKPGCYRISVGHCCSTLNLHLLLCVVEVHRQGGRVGVNTRSMELKLEKTSRQVSCHVTEVTHLGTFNVIWATL